jgi:hypothetical protein
VNPVGGDPGGLANPGREEGTEGKSGNDDEGTSGKEYFDSSSFSGFPFVLDMGVGAESGNCLPKSSSDGNAFSKSSNPFVSGPGPAFLLPVLCCGMGGRGGLDDLAEGGAGPE